MWLGSRQALQPGDRKTQFMIAQSARFGGVTTRTNPQHSMSTAWPDVEDQTPATPQRNANQADCLSGAGVPAP